MRRLFVVAVLAMACGGSDIPPLKPAALTEASWSVDATGACVCPGATSRESVDHDTVVTCEWSCASYSPVVGPPVTGKDVILRLYWSPSIEAGNIVPFPYPPGTPGAWIPLTEEIRPGACL